MLIEYTNAHQIIQKRMHNERFFGTPFGITAVAGAEYAAPYTPSDSSLRLYLL